MITQTTVCRDWVNDSCFSTNCPYSHGPSKNNVTKIKKPCWWFNNGGCKHNDGTEKSEKDCKYLHVKAEVRKPLHLQHPCYNWHIRTPGRCNIKNCLGDHGEYKLTAKEWQYHFGGVKKT